MYILFNNESRKKQTLISFQIYCLCTDKTKSFVEKKATHPRARRRRVQRENKNARDLENPHVEIIASIIDSVVRR